MRLITNKNIKRKILIAILIIIVASFIFPVKAQASIGGKLLEPVIDLVVALGDGTYNIVHRVILDQEETLIRVEFDDGFWATVAKIFVAIGAAILAAVVIIGTAGIAAAVAGITITVSVGTMVFCTVGAGVAALIVFDSAYFPDDMVLPVYNVSPEEIFSNEIGIFSVDFFNPVTTLDDQYMIKLTDKKDSPSNYKKIENIKIDNTWDEAKFASYIGNFFLEVFPAYNWRNDLESVLSKYLYFNAELTPGSKSALIFDNVANWAELLVLRQINIYNVSDKQVEVFESAQPVRLKTILEKNEDGTYNYIIEKYDLQVEKVNTRVKGIAYDLRDNVANWYVSIRNIVIVGMMSVLVYIGIRILISSTSSDKAKYKQFLMDWIVAMCLVFIMHYIMAFSNTIVNKITSVISSLQSEKYTTVILPDKDGEITDTLEDGLSESEIEQLYLKDESGNYQKDSNGDKLIMWPTNLIGYARTEAQMAQEATERYAGYALIFIVLVFFTIFFIFTYIKRIVYMAFLTIIAPLVALTYPIDKINDGKAQAFDMWLKEYIFNLLIQPMHLILYTILVTSAFELATKNILYAVVAIGFMMPAEKLLRKFFGFEKAQTPGMLGGAAGAALTMSALGKGLGRLAHGPKDEKEGKSKDSDDDDSSIKYSDRMDSMGSLLGDGNSNQDTTNTSDSEAPQVRTQENIDNNDTSTVDNPDLRVNTPVDQTPSGITLPQSEIQRRQEEEARRRKQEEEERVQRYRSATESNTQRQLPHQDRMQIRKPSIKNALRSGAVYYAHGMRKKMKDKHFARRTLRFAGGLALGGAAGMIGAAAGIASGDPGKAIQYAATGASGGYLAGKGVTGRVARMPGAVRDTFKVEGTAQAFGEGYYGTEGYEESQIQRNIRDAQKDYEIRHELERTLQHDQAKVERAEREIVPLATRYGMGNAKDISAIAEYMDKTNSSAEESTAIVKEVKSYGKNTSKLGQKEHDDLEKTLRRRIKSKMPNGTEQDIENNATRIRNAMDSASKIYYKS